MFFVRVLLGMCFIMFYNVLWCLRCFIVFYGVYGVVWCFMMLYGGLWCFMVIYDVLWCFITFYQNHAALEHVLYIRAGMQMQGGAFLKSRHSWSKIVASSSLVLRHPRRNWTACACSLWCEAFAPQTASARLLLPLSVPLHHRGR